ncbi:DNA-binding transcriptional regulator, LysR family [Desulforamulus putei DSM 12395]|uniref:DNA-binding transcriptional regulator, LysR family n=1 Tax=Desulforamulus putei DSM 12395 TaxID=1121429 RepID=A0A1M4SBU3_9FIRM|nr:LysR substrate-binding domain-containing protein [Desulforamulus putei]SHE29676.1 DNA-binding transcriptional regulator, LysR family [Desulforamulus putei DSM 12395]
MNLSHFKVFYTLAETGSLAKTSKLLELSQPTINHNIYLLEQHYGAKLFDRSNKKIKLTRFGQVLQRYVSEILSLVEQSEKHIENLVRELSGNLYLGASHTIAENVLPKIMGMFNHDYPEVDIHLEVTNTQHIVDHILENKLDLGLIEGPVTHEKIIAKPFMEDELLVVLPYNHPLAIKKNLTLNELATLPFVLREEGSGTRVVMETALKKAGLDPGELNTVMELGNTQAVIGAVEAGLGATILSGLAVTKEIQLKTVKTCRIANVNIVRFFSLILNKDKPLSPICETFLSFITTEEVLEMFKN